MLGSNVTLHVHKIGCTVSTLCVRETPLLSEALTSASTVKTPWRCGPRPRPVSTALSRECKWDLKYFPDKHGHSFHGSACLSLQLWVLKGYVYFSQEICAMCYDLALLGAGQSNKRSLHDPGWHRRETTSLRHTFTSLC